MAGYNYNPYSGNSAMVVLVLVDALARKLMSYVSLHKGGLDYV